MEGKLRVLFLEDEDTIREVLSEYMLVAGFDVTSCDNGDEALEKLLKNKYDIGVLDIMVPGITGLEVLDSMRKKGIDIPILILTAFDDEKTQIQAFNSLADDFIAKPVSPIILIKRMESVLRRYKHNRNKEGLKEERKSEGLVIVKESYSAYYDGINLNLTVSEYLILESLMSRPQMIFTREQLINKVFNDEYITSPRIIDSHIKNLRKKLPKDHVRTVIGVGYQFKGGEGR